VTFLVERTNPNVAVEGAVLSEVVLG